MKEADDPVGFFYCRLRSWNDRHGVRSDAGQEPGSRANASLKSSAMRRAASFFDNSFFDNKVHTKTKIRDAMSNTNRAVPPPVRSDVIAPITNPAGERPCPRTLSPT